MAQTLRISVEVVPLDSDYARCTSFDWLRLCTFQLKWLQFAQNIRVSLEVVVIGSDFVRFS